MTLQNVPFRGRIFNINDSGDCFYIILSGSVGIWVNDESSHVESLVKVADLGPGDYFGELALLYDHPRSAAAIALLPSELIVLSKDVYDKVIKNVHNH